MRYPAPTKGSGSGEILPCFFLGQLCVAEVTDQTTKYKVVPGFKLEKIYDVKKEKGSWVTLKEDGEGSLISADQYGKLYRFPPRTSRRWRDDC